MVIQNKLVLDKNQTVLPQLLKFLGLNYAEFARRINIPVATLENYRYGSRTCRFTTPQIKAIIALLEEAGLTFKDLPDDWILDKKS